MGNEDLLISRESFYGLEQIEEVSERAHATLFREAGFRGFGNQESLAGPDEVGGFAKPRIVARIRVGCQLDLKAPPFGSEVDYEVDLVLVARSEMIQVMRDATRVQFPFDLFDDEAFPACSHPRLILKLLLCCDVK